jgi:multidrug efflux pump subunit AcrA (membrane-fusion protein)
MIHKHIKSLPHHPRRVIIISLIIALAAGTFGYIKINQKITSPTVKDNTYLGTSTGGDTSSHDLTLGFLAGGRIKSVSVRAGEMAKKGQVLASLDAGNTMGALTQAKAAYETAQANYQKIINGATGVAIDVAKAAVNTAQINLDGVTKQQNLLVTNAHANLLNSTLSANLVGSDNSITPPSISGAYVKDVEGSITFSIVSAGNGGYVNFSGIASGTTTVSTTSPQAIGDTGLYIEFTSINPYIGTTWQINIPNNNAPNYLANYNAYQSALETKNQAIGNAQASLDQAKASLTALATSARPEDVKMAQAQMDNAAGAVQIAQAAFQNTIIIAPSDGTIVSVAITPGQIAMPNAPAIEFISLTSAN